MKKIFLSLIIAASSLIASAQVVPTPTGAKITLDGVTTEVVVYNPKLVRVVKYTEQRPEITNINVNGKEYSPQSKEFKTSSGHNKFKLDTGKMYAAINDKDANVSFWRYNDRLILAEQHKTGVFSKDEDGNQQVSQDFQFGRAAVGHAYCPYLESSRQVNVLGSQVKAKIRANQLPVPSLVTDKGFQIVWLADDAPLFDALKRDDPKKQGDVRFTSSAPVIDYVFLIQ